jgi:uncharacterized membrane protein YgcG
MLKTVGTVLVMGLAVAAAASGSRQGDTHALTAKLTAKAEVPKPAGVTASASGSFTGTATELANDKARVTWSLTFKRLTGSAAAAHVHFGRPGKAGPVAIALCAPCRSGQKGTAMTTHAVWNKIKAGGAYVNVHTKMNPAGEIRGQLEAADDDSSGSGSGGGSDTGGGGGGGSDDGGGVGY